MSQLKYEISMLILFENIRSIVRHLLSRWKFILLVAFFFGVGGILYAWFKKPVYTAEMSFVTDTEGKGGLSAYAGIAAQFGIDFGGGNSTLFEGDNLIELLKSRNMIVQTLLESADSKAKGKLLVEYYLQSEGLHDHPKIRNIEFSSFGSMDDRKRDSIIIQCAQNIVKNDLIIQKRDRKLSIIDLSVKSKSEFFAKRFAELLSENVISYYTDYKLKKSRQNVSILERQADSVRRILYSGIGSIAVINDLNVNPARQSLRTNSQLKQVEVQTNAALYTELVKHLELSRLSLRKETPLIQIIDSPMLPLKMKGIGRFYAGVVFAALGGILAILLVLLMHWIRLLKAKNSYG